MAFFGESFSFNGIDCMDFELMLYDLESSQQENVSFASTPTVVDELVGDRWKPYFYGVQFDKKLTFTIVFGVNQQRLDDEKYLTRYEIDEISSWLTGHKTYHWLEIMQEDMSHARYRCMISELTLITYGQIPWALGATVTCDGAYAYTYPKEFRYTIDGVREFTFYNESSYNGYFMPYMELSNIQDSSFSIENLTDGGVATTFTDIPDSVEHIIVDNEHEIVKEDGGMNMYPFFNCSFFRLKRGFNKIRVNGRCELKFLCEFPINIGG